MSSFNRFRSLHFTASTQQLLIQNHSLSLFFSFFFVSSVSLSYALSQILYRASKMIIMQAKHTEYMRSKHLILSLSFHFQYKSICISFQLLVRSCFSVCMYLCMCVCVCLCVCHTAQCVYLCFLLPFLYSVCTFSRWLCCGLLYVFGFSALNSNSSMSHSTVYMVLFCLFIRWFWFGAKYVCSIYASQYNSWSQYKKPYRWAVSVLHI